MISHDHDVSELAFTNARRFINIFCWKLFYRWGTCLLYRKKIGPVAQLTDRMRKYYVNLKKNWHQVWDIFGTKSAPNWTHFIDFHWKSLILSILWLNISSWLLGVSIQTWYVHLSAARALSEKRNEKFIRLATKSHGGPTWPVISNFGRSRTWTSLLLVRVVHRVLRRAFR